MANWLDGEILRLEDEIVRLDRAIAREPTAGREHRRRVLEARFDDLWAIRAAIDGPRAACGKVAYPEERLAKMVLAEIVRGGCDRAPSTDFTVYRCVVCEGWHCGHRFTKRAYGRYAHTLR